VRPIYQGEASRNFLACYVQGQRVLALAGCQHDREMTAITALMRRDRLPSPEELRQGPVDFLKRLKESYGDTIRAHGGLGQFHGIMPPTPYPLPPMGERENIWISIRFKPMDTGQAHGERG
jgi:hypothetical protein